MSSDRKTGSFRGWTEARAPFNLFKQELGYVERETGYIGPSYVSAAELCIPFHPPDKPRLS